MSVETFRAIAQVAAKQLAREWGEQADDTTVEEYIASELPGLDHDQVDTVIKFTKAFLRVKNVSIYFDEYMVDDEGNVLTREEAEARAYNGF